MTRTRRFVASLIPLITMLLGAVASAATAQPLQDGVQYTRLKSAQPVETGNKIEVIEFFSYGCPHCADLDPYLQDWAKKLPSDVQFRRVPVLFQDRWIALAKVYYTLEALGAEARLTPDVFAAIHRQNVGLWSDKAFYDWAAGKGLDRKKVQEMYESFGTNGKVNRAKQLGGIYNVQSVPYVIVDGKFATASDKVGGHQNMPAVMNALITMARSERGGGAHAAPARAAAGAKSGPAAKH